MASGGSTLNGLRRTATGGEVLESSITLLNSSAESASLNGSTREASMFAN
jgi:hypothetical protein